jgi:hypothetical protein
VRGIEAEPMKMKARRHARVRKVFQSLEVDVMM